MEPKPELENPRNSKSKLKCSLGDDCLLTDVDVSERAVVKLARGT